MKYNRRDFVIRVGLITASLSSLGIVVVLTPIKKSNTSSQNSKENE